jgi:CTP:molybdopterin cytidylyltransferase MocA
MVPEMIRPPVNVVLLAAGRGSRLSTLTERTHKSLLPVAGKPGLEYIIDAVLTHGVEQVVIVTGDKHEAIENFVATQFPGRVQTVLNERFAADTNILSTEIGVSALRRPEEGYLIIETDMVVEPAGWAAIIDVGEGRESQWVTRDTYSPSLTGGALHADADGRVTSIVYSRTYEERYEGWQKLLGTLYVGRDQVAADRELRRAAIERTIAQYYMMPWVENGAQLPCRAKALGDLYAASYNDLATYELVNQQFSEVLESALGNAGSRGRTA